MPPFQWFSFSLGLTVALLTVGGALAGLRLYDRWRLRRRIRVALTRAAGPGRPITLKLPDGTVVMPGTALTGELPPEIPMVLTRPEGADLRVRFVRDEPEGTSYTLMSKPPRHMMWIVGRRGTLALMRKPSKERTP